MDKRRYLEMKIITEETLMTATKQKATLKKRLSKFIDEILDKYPQSQYQCKMTITLNMKTKKDIYIY